MVVAPQHPPVHSYGDSENPFDIVETPWGSIERWRATALETGSLGAMTALSKQVRNDLASIAARLDAREAELNARADAISARELQHAVNVTQFVDFVGKASVLFDKLQKARADQMEEPIALPPGGDPSDPNKLPEPSLSLEGDSIPGKAPGDPSEVDSDGDRLRLKHPVSADQSELPHPPVTEQP